jgi:alpha-L-fucosidase
VELGWYPTFDTSVDAGDPAYADLYGPKVSVAAWQQKDSAERPNDLFNQRWLAKVEEVVTKYKPDMLYFDSRLAHIGEPYRKKMVTTFFNTPPQRRDKVILYKGQDLPEGVGMRTHEKSRLTTSAEKPWLTEEPITTYSWSYTDDIVLRQAKDILNGLIDIVSKNGIFLLNICPKSDGTIPKDQQEILLAMGDWLHKNGEGIYNTRPWYTFGEGPKSETEDKADPADRTGYFKAKYTARDIRYTRKGNTIYAHILGKPEAGKNVLLQSFSKHSLPYKLEVVRITLPGSKEKIRWDYLDSGLSLHIPDHLQDTMAIVVKVETREK